MPNHKLGDLVYSLYCGLGVIREIRRETSILVPTQWFYRVEWMNDIHNKGNFYTENQVNDYKKLLRSKIATGRATDYVE